MLFAKLYGLDEPEKTAAGVARTHRTRPRPRRPGPRILARHAAAPGRGARLPARARSPAARRAVHRARRSRHRRAAIACWPTRTPPGAPSSCPRINCAKRWKLATHVALIQRGQLAFTRRAHPADGRRYRLAVPDVWRQLKRGLLPAGVVHHRRQGSALRDAHQGSVQRLLRLLAGDPGAVQLRLRSVVGRVAHHLGRPAVAGLLLRRSAGAESQLRARTAERLPGRADLVARAGVGHLLGQNFSEFFAADDRRNSSAGRLRRAL